MCVYLALFVNDVLLYSYWRNNKDAVEDFFNNIYLLLYCKGSKRLCGILLWEGARDRT